jgi:uncharacterized protein YndB with AHSA1/START domain
MSTATLKSTTSSDREIAITRVFDAPRNRVFGALTEPELLKRWLLGPDGWTMPVCEIDLEVGGAYRFVWRNAEGTEMGMGGVFREVGTEHFVATEKFDQAWYPGAALVTNAVVERAGRTTLSLTIRYESKEARDGVVKSGMERGVARSYERLAELLASTSAR